jgi:hypothetical protein
MALTSTNYLYTYADVSCSTDTLSAEINPVLYHRQRSEPTLIYRLDEMYTIKGYNKKFIKKLRKMVWKLIKCPCEKEGKCIHGYRKDGVCINTFDTCEEGRNFYKFAAAVVAAFTKYIGALDDESI